MGETPQFYHFYCIYRRSQEKAVEVFAPKKGILTDFLSEDWNLKNIDFKPYNDKSGRTLYPYQEEAVKFLTSRKKGILASEMGSGKTLAAIIAALEDKYEKYLDEAKAFESDRAYDYEKYVDDEKSLIDGIRYDVETAYQKSRDDEKDRQWQSEFDYRALRDAISDEQWQTKADTDRYNVVARLIQSVYNKSNIGVNIDRIMRILGLE